MGASESEVNLNNLTPLDSSTYDDMVLLPEGWSAFGELLVDDNRVRIRTLSVVQDLTHSRYYLPAPRSGIMQSHRIIASSLVKHATQTGVGRSSKLPTMSGVIADFMQKIILYEENTEFEFDEEMKSPC